MRLYVVAVGRRAPAWVDAGFADYARRMPREAQLVLKAVKPQSRGGATANAATIERIRTAESRRIVAALPRDGYIVVLDEGGRTFTTRQLAGNLGRWQGAGRDVAFIIGGADGTAEALRNGANMVWSLSPLTLPHHLVRVVLAEQLYRAVSILNNHPYHRE